MTQENYRKQANRHIRPAPGFYKLTSIRRETVQNFINGLFKDNYSRNTLVNIPGMIPNSLRYARRQGWIETNPADDIDLPASRQCVRNRKKVREPVPKYILDKIFERFPEEHPEHLPLMLAYHCGLRLGEVFGLTWDDVDLEWGAIYVKQQVQWSNNDHVYKVVPPKYDSCRRVKLDNVIWSLLRREKKRQDIGRLERGPKYKQLFIDDKGCLNTEQRGIPIHMVNTRPDGSYVQERVTHHASRVIKTELGYEKFDFHSLRHTHATELCEAGVNIKEIQRRLGHSTMEVTSKRYLHATDQMEAQSLELMNHMYGCDPNGDAPNDGAPVRMRLVR